MTRPHVLLSAAASIDGYLDTRPGEDRLMLSNKADFDRVDSVRAGVDAILIGAGTLRADNPRLLVNSELRRAARLTAGQSEYPLKVTVTGTGDLDPDWKFWHHGGDKLVLAAGDAATNKARSNLGDLATVHTIPTDAVWPSALDALGQVYGVKRLMVEGGGIVHTRSSRLGSPTNYSSSSPLCSSASRTRYACSARPTTPALLRASDCWSRARSTTWYS